MRLCPPTSVDVLTLENGDALATEYDPNPDPLATVVEGLAAKPLVDANAEKGVAIVDGAGLGAGVAAKPLVDANAEKGDAMLDSAVAAGLAEGVEGVGGGA